MKSGKRIDLSGQIFGRLTVISLHGIHPKGQCLWKCKCICGNETVLLGTTLKRGVTKSCGCLLRSRNGLANTSTYSIWHSMIARCHNPKSVAYKNYGARGISVCDRWKDNFFAFLEDMGERPAGLSIDRIDNNDNYFKENCHWATPKEQTRNCRSNHFIEAFGKKMILQDWAKEIGKNVSCIRRRIAKGWPIEDVLSAERISRWRNHKG